MAEQVNVTRLEGRRLVLGFDGGCFTCSGLAKEIEKLSEGRLEVLSLRDPQMEQWRNKALGANASWAPTLIEIKDLKVRAWTGWRMGVNLSRLLGPGATWRVMQALGEISVPPKVEESVAAKVLSGMSRGQFLKGAAGAAVAVGVLSGLGPLAGRAEALEEWEYPKSTNSTELKGTKLRDYCDRIAQRADSEWVAGGYATAMQSGLSVDSSTDTVASGGGVKARAWIHTMANGNEMYVCSFNLKNEKIVTYFEYARMRNNIKTEIKRWGLGSDEKNFYLERLTVNGARFTDPGAPSLRTQAASCPEQCQDITGFHQIKTCSVINVACILGGVGCLGCAGACGGTGAACFFCVVPVCGGAATQCCSAVCTVCVPCAPSI